MPDREKLIKAWEIFRDSNPYQICEGKEFRAFRDPEYCMGQMIADTIDLLKEQPEIVRCKECKHWDKTTRKEGNDFISGPWEDAECNKFRDWDRWGDLGESFSRTNGDWFCADGERRDSDG